MPPGAVLPVDGGEASEGHWHLPIPQVELVSLSPSWLLILRCLILALMAMNLTHATV